MLKSKLTHTLDTKAIGYEVIHHVPDYSALETAHDTHTPGSEFAKAVVVDTPGGPVLALVPAPQRVDLRRFAQIVNAHRVGLAPEKKLEALFPDCQLGAEPPFGHLYGLPVYLDESLAGEEYITFNAGSHDEAIRMRLADFERMERPTHAAFAID
jgi:Ala-tRNA(Pro) deacylase